MTRSIWEAAKQLHDSVSHVVNCLLYTNEKRFNHTRNAEMRRLYEQGHASSEEIIRAEFGGEMPHGLDVPLDQNFLTKSEMLIDALFENEQTRKALFDSDRCRGNGHFRQIPAWQNAIIRGNTSILQRYNDHGFDFMTVENIDITYSTENSIADMFGIYGTLLDDIKKGEEALKPGFIRSIFSVSAAGFLALKNLKVASEDLSKGLQYVLDNAPDIDIPIPRRSSISDISIRDAAADVGILPSNEGSLILTKSDRVDDAAHL